MDTAATQQDNLPDAQSREAERLAVLHSLGLLDIAATEDFDQITQLAAHCFSTPVALISLVDADRQQFLSRVGFGPSQTPRETSVCSHAIRGTDILEVEDLSQDPRFLANPLVVGEPNIRFYAGVPLLTASGHAIGALCVIDFQARRLSEAEREQLSTLGRLVMDRIALRQSVGRRDPVTHLPNRQQIVADLDALPEVGAGGSRALALVDVLSLSASHEVAQAVGLSVVDSLLRYAAEQVQAELPPHVNLYHVGVTRFAFWYDPVTHADVLDRLQERLRSPARGAGVPLQLRPVVGVVPFEPGLIAASDLLRQAMIAVNAAYAAHQPVSWYHREADESQRRRYRLALDLRHALQRGQFHLVFQPRVAPGERRVVGLEALIRWDHPEYGAISPGQFIPLLERTAWMQPLTLWVIDQSLQQLRAWRQVHPELRVSVNLSARDFDDGGLVPGVLAACARHEATADWLELEVTEGEWLHGHPDVLEQLDRLVQAGVTLAIDDFGAGYSNFAYMNRIPAQVLKVDQSLVAGVFEDERRAVLVRGIVSLALRLGYRTVAEGVETEEILRFVLDCGCHEIQGFYYARPLAPADVPTFLARFAASAGQPG